ncbi:MAG: efflux RND transporter periplasmic adaptor subunit [Cyclobacteriaceae bacterium]|nr:efflux RND transporter periplasmic adaptor subunit [Cyclobacteriaceae bacterium]
MELRKVAIVLTGLGLIALSVYGSGVLSSMKEPPKRKPEKTVNKYVKTAPVNYTNVKTEITAFGRVKTAQTLDLISEVSGRMFKGAVPLKEGQRFRKGALLFRVDDEEPRLNLQAQKSNFLRELASILPDMKIDFSDSYSDWNDYFNAVRMDEVLPELPAYKSQKEKTFLATKNIFSSFYNIKSAEARLKKHRFYAPFSGAIYSVNIHSGSYVNPGNNIGRLIQSDRLELKLDVEASEIGWISEGTETDLYAENGQHWKGKVTRIGEYVNQNTQSINVFVSIDPDDRPLFDGQFLRAVMPSRIIPNSMIVPRNVIMGGDQVYTVQDTLLKLHEIKIHKINEETVVFSGLEEGAELVIEPLVNAFNGMVVHKIEQDEKDIDMEEKKSETKLVNN